MKLVSGNVAIDLVALRKQFNLRPDEKAEAHHVQAFFDGKRWHVLAEAGGSLSWRGHKRFISSHESYASALKTFEGWKREDPRLIYFQPDGSALLIKVSGYTQPEECLKNTLALHTAGLIPLTEKERNKIICELDPTKLLELGEDRGPEAVWFNIPNGKVYWNRFFGGRAYTAISPMGDSERLAAMGDRLMFTHGEILTEAKLFVAPKGTVTVGYVVGLMKPETV